MSWSSKLLDMFINSGEDKLKKIPLEELNSWIDSCTQEVISEFKLNDQLTNYVNSLKDKHWLLEYKLDEWQEKVNTLGISMRARHNLGEAMSILLDTKSLLGLLVFPEQISLDDALRLNSSSLDPKIKKLIQKVETSSFAPNVSMIFAPNNHPDDLEEHDLSGNQDTPVNPLYKELVEIDNLKKNFETKINESGYHNILILKERLAMLQDYVSKLKELNSELDSKQERLTLAKESRMDKEEQLSHLGAAGYPSSENKKKEKEDVLKQIKEEEREIIILFSMLRPLLQEYKKLESRMEFENKVVNSYLDNPVNAFLDDGTLSIKYIIQHIRSLLKTRSFSLSSLESDSLLRQLEPINANSLEEMRFRYLQLRENLNISETPVWNNDSLAHREDAEYRLDHFSKQVDKLEEEISLCTRKITDIEKTRDNEKELFEGLARIGLKKKISIVFG